MTWLHADKAIIGDGKTVLSPGWVSFEGKKILEVTDQKPASATPENTVELPGMTLTPGLLNIHDHVCRKSFRITDASKNFGEMAAKLMAQDKQYIILQSAYNMRKYLTEEGITFTRDYGLAGHSSLHLKRAISDGLAVGPEIDACGEPLCITGGHCYRISLQVDGEAEVMKAVRQQIVAGATIIKFMGSGGLERFPDEDPTMPQFTVAELTAGVNCAHDLGFDTAAHAYSNEGIRRGIAANVDNIEHGAMMTEDCIEMMAKKGIHFNPTGSGLRGAVTRGSQIKYIDMLRERIFERQEQGIRWAKEAGILVGAGTDSPGFLYEEIEFLGKTLSETPVQALEHALGINAKIAKRADIGLLKKGCRADIVAWKGDLEKSLEPLRAGLYMTWCQGEPFEGIAYTK